MIRYTSEKQTTLPGFETPFDVELDLNNRWATLAQIIPWDDLALAYYSTFASHYGRPAKDARMVIGAVIMIVCCPLMPAVGIRPLARRLSRWLHWLLRQ